MIALSFSFVALVLAASATLSHGLVPKQTANPPGTLVATSLAGKLLHAQLPPVIKNNEPRQVELPDGENVTYSDALGVEDIGVDHDLGYPHPVVFFLLGSVFLIIALLVCYCLPRLDGVTLGIAGTFEHRMQQQRQGRLSGMRLEKLEAEEKAKKKQNEDYLTLAGSFH
eukprot:TRINITY_DN117867_c0_g1_i1.p1 TRINITY_DN117867_c0_g1~~TRINITY_DN117867_c0_g1_i1.p1  ORF type:complete len:169 (-),score=28.45 TRINITY_DN117867_c0_g1_i1:129-635(-)